MSSTKVLFIFSVLVVLIQTIRCNSVCEGIIPDAITRLQNGTIAVFQDKNFFFYDIKDKSMIGPCPIHEQFKAMSGPVDAAVTFEGHDSVTEFVGSSVFFSKGHFYTFRNLRPYQVEWGALVYLPVNGKQDAMGASEEAKKLMPTKISAAYYDPLTSRSKFIFPDGSILGFNFELGSEYDTPMVSNLDTEFEKFHISGLPKTLTAALTLTEAKKTTVYLFDGNKYCDIQIDLKQKNQKCTFKPVSDFFGCKTLKPVKHNCGPSAGFEGRAGGGGEDAIQVSQAVDTAPGATDSTIVQTIKTRDSGGDANQTKPANSCHSLFNGYVFCKLFLFLTFLSIL